MLIASLAPAGCHHTRAIGHAKVCTATAAAAQPTKQPQNPISNLLSPPSTWLFRWPDGGTPKLVFQVKLYSEGLLNTKSPEVANLLYIQVCVCVCPEQYQHPLWGLPLMLQCVTSLPSLNTGCCRLCTMSFSACTSCRRRMPSAPAPCRSLSSSVPMMHQSTDSTQQSPSIMVHTQVAHIWASSLLFAWQAQARFPVQDAAGVHPWHHHSQQAP